MLTPVTTLKASSMNCPEITTAALVQFIAYTAPPVPMGRPIKQTMTEIAIAFIRNCNKILRPRASIVIQIPISSVLFVTEPA